jgi:hypothetical protein
VSLRLRCPKAGSLLAGLYHWLNEKATLSKLRELFILLYKESPFVKALIKHTCSTAAMISGEPMPEARRKAGSLLRSRPASSLAYHWLFGALPFSYFY